MTAAVALSVHVTRRVAHLGSRCVGNSPGRVAEGGDGKAESLVGTSPRELGAGLPYG